MRRNRALSTIALSSVAAAALTSAVRAQGSADKIRVTGPPTEDATSMYYAIKSGAFGRGGIDAEYTPSNSGAAGVAAVIAGSFEITRTSLNAVLAAHLRGIDMVLIAPANVHDSRTPLALLQTPVDSTIKTGAELNGKVVAVPSLGDLNTIAVRAWSDKNGGDWKSLKLVELPNSAIEAALEQHRIDAAIMQSPQVFASLAAGTTRTLGDAWSAIAPRFQVGVYVARKDWITSHPDLVRRILSIYGEATAYTNSHPAETAPYAAEMTKAELASVQKMRRTVYATTLEPDLIQPVIDAAAKYDAISRRFPAREIFAFG
jgi:NitT/TauT family transport system substrate-binding protein